ncbi:unnamed protein product, partial [Prorocentrum cordatum]
ASGDAEYDNGTVLNTSAGFESEIGHDCEEEDKFTKELAAAMEASEDGATEPCHVGLDDMYDCVGEERVLEADEASRPSGGAGDDGEDGDQRPDHNDGNVHLPALSQDGFMDCDGLDNGGMAVVAGFMEDSDFYDFNSEEAGGAASAAE